jgi:hypothetical protein
VPFRQGFRVPSNRTIKIHMPVNELATIQLPGTFNSEQVAKPAAEVLDSDIAMLIEAWRVLQGHEDQMLTYTPATSVILLASHTRTFRPGMGWTAAMTRESGKGAIPTRDARARCA